MPQIVRDKGFFAALATLFLAVLLGFLAPAGSARAAAGPWADQEQAKLRLVAAGQAAGTTDSLSFGLQFQLQPGWKIYWRSPGDAGYPPTVDWSDSQNLAEASLAWPVPHRFSLFGLETFGYSDEVVFPIKARVERPGQPVILRAKVGYLTCNEICIPRDAELTLALPAGSAGPSPEGFLIDSYRTRVPGDGSNVGLSLDRAVLTGSLEAPVLQVTARSDIAFGEPDIMIEAPPGFFFGKPEISFADNRKTAVLRTARTGAPTEWVLEGKRLTLTVTDGVRAMEQEVIARFATPPMTGTGGAALIAILGFALLGGLILNLMPCVLPVLSIKLLSVVKHGGRATGEVRASFLASAAGILTAFMVLAAIAVALKAFGLTVGWGIQFQQPLFLSTMALVITLFACNLFGFFEIPLPGWVQRLASIGVAGGPGHAYLERSLAGHFLTGALATLLATPCSAPFLGTAVGFALARGPSEIFLIFAMLGLGLALPYLLIAAVPALASRLPRPGPWMITLKRILGLALIGTAIWLLSVLAAQVGLAPALGVGALLAGLGLVIGILRGRTSERRMAASALAGLLALAAVTLPAAFPARQGAALTNGSGSKIVAGEEWVPLNPGLIPALIAEGKVVFVDVTADWCLTCQVNKSLVLDKDSVRDRLNGEGIVTMRGDWTLPSDEISRYLESFGRYGIPFNAVYGPSAPAGLALPEILTVDRVLETLEQAGGTQSGGVQARGSQAGGG